MEKKEAIQIVQVPVQDLKPSEYNPRMASEKEVNDLTESITKFGLVDPIIVNSAENRKNIVIGGHFRLRVATEMGFTDMPVIYRNLPNIEDEKELNLRLNFNSGSFDYDLLANFDEDMLIDVGFTPVEIDNIFELETGQIPEDEVPEEREKTDQKMGTIWQLGEHRLMLGSGTDAAQVAKLMGEAQADMVFTDPLYNVNYSGRGKDTSEKIKNDNMTEEDFDDFIYKAFEALSIAMREGAVFYICSGWSSYPVFNLNLLKNGFYRAGVIIWVKNQASLGWNDFRYKHEWICVGKKKRAKTKGVSILYGWKKGSHYFRDTRDEYDVWEVPREHSAKMVHPTQKPIYLISKAVANSTKRGENVLDTFGESGCTLIACERLKRKSFTMEFDPVYCQVIINRWEQYTGQKAEVLNG